MSGHTRPSRELGDPGTKPSLLSPPIRPSFVMLLSTRYSYQDTGVIAIVTPNEDSAMRLPRKDVAAPNPGFSVQCQVSGGVSS